MTKRLNVPLDEQTREAIERIAETEDRSLAYVASGLIELGLEVIKDKRGGRRGEIQKG